jgi:hypothetical protein
MANFAQLKAKVTRKLGLDSTTGSDEQNMVGEHLNEAVLDVLLETHLRVSVGTATLAANESDYELDADILAIDTVLAGTVPMVRMSPDQILDLRRGSATSSSGVMRYAVSGSNLLMVWPTPSSASTLTIYFVPKPTAMSADTHDPSESTYGGIPVEHHKGLELYALWQGADYDNNPKADAYYGQYTAWQAKIRKARVHKGGTKLPRGRLARRRSLSADPSSD